MTETSSPAAAAAHDLAPAADGALEEWPARPWITAGLLGFAAFLVYLILDPGSPEAGETPWRAALAALVGFSALMLAFTLRPAATRGPALFATVVGLVMAGIAWRVAAAGDRYAEAPFWFFAGAVAGALALPLFQARFHRLRWRTSYAETHFHVWTDAISVGGALAFLGLSWLLLFLLSELFAAIRIEALRDLTGEEWFGFTFSGAAFGAALGTLRNSLAVLGTLQRVVMLVFAILAVPLALALAIFLGAVALSGPDVLWEATRSATPLLLAAALGAFVLANAVLRDSDAHASPARLQRGAAALLALGILPLAGLAAVSMGARVAQHGLSPERLWALVAVAVAVAYGAGYFVAAVRARRAGWDALRRTNLHLAVGSCALALVLALPVFDFGAISTRSQLARLERGAVTAEEFDYAALHWDFGDAGRAALARLARGGRGETARLAREEQARTQRYYPSFDESGVRPRARLANLRSAITEPGLRAALEEQIQAEPWLCDKPCVALDTGPAGSSAAASGSRLVALVEEGAVTFYTLAPRPAQAPARPAPPAVSVAPARAAAPAPAQAATSRVEIREWTGRRVYIDGKPAGEPFE